MVQQQAEDRIIVGERRLVQRCAAIFSMAGVDFRAMLEKPFDDICVLLAAKNNGVSPLLSFRLTSAPSLKGMKEAAEILLSRGADAMAWVEGRGMMWSDKTALHIAARFGKREVAEVLLAYRSV